MCESMSEEKKEEVTETGSEEEERKKHRHGIVEYIPDEDFPPLIPEVVEALGMGELEEPAIPLPDIRTLIKMIGKRTNAFLILKFFYKRNDAYSAADLSRALKPYMCESTVNRNLNKLCKVGVLKATRVPQYDKKAVYYTMMNKEVIGYIVKDWLNRISYILGRVVPYDKVSVQQLKQNKKFIDAHKEFALTFDEAIDLVRKCPNIEFERHGSGVALLSRRQQW